MEDGRRNSTNNQSSNFRRFEIPPPTSFDSVPSTSQGPLLFPRYYLNPPQVRPSSLTFPSITPQQSTTLYFPTATPRPPPAASTSFTFPAETTPRGQPLLFTSSNNNDTPDFIQDSASSSGETSSGSKGRGKNWSDAETRYLLEIWRERYRLNKRRNSGAWDSIATELNKVLSEQGINTFRTGAQCKVRIKNLEDEYKRVKDHNNRSGNDTETFDYYEDLDMVLGCKPNITPKVVVNCGLDESLLNSFEASPDEKESDDDYDADDSLESTSTGTPLERKTVSNSTQGKRTAKGKQPAKTPLKKAKKSSAQSDYSELLDFLNTSQQKDHEFFSQLADKESERELKSQKLMFDTVKEIAKIFKGNN